MRTLIEDVGRRIDDLLNTLKSKGFDPSLINSVADIKNSILNMKTPAIPSRVLWDKYTQLVILVEEANRIANKKGYEHVLHDIVVSLRDKIVEFKSALNKSYLVERIQLALPSVLGAVYAILRLIGEPYETSLILLFIALMSIALSAIKATYGLLGSGVLGVAFIIMGGDLGSVFTGALLIAIALVYIYILSMTNSGKFKAKVQSILDGINKLVGNVFASTQVGVDEVFKNIIESGYYNVDYSGLFKFLDKNELLRYKAAVMAAHGLTYRTHKVLNNISQK
ncbi:MAG: hypothetical protein QXS24_05980 [Desulfurococcaceae archaeon]